MIRIIVLILTLFLTACETNKKADLIQDTLKSKNFRSKDIVNDITSKKQEIVDIINYDFATYYIVVADTNLDYSVLYDKMFRISQKMNITIDTMGRSYNEVKNLIALPDNDEDDIYAGNYYPRRYPSGFLSLEYLNFYSKNANKKTIALMSGIYENEISADSALAIINKIEKNSFKIKAEVYIGCMH
jgi:hypothetical protein